MIVESQWATFISTWVHFNWHAITLPLIESGIYLLTLSSFLCLISHPVVWLRPWYPTDFGTFCPTLLITKSNGLSLLLLPSTRLDHLSHWLPHPSWPTLLYLVLWCCYKCSRTCWEWATLKSLSQKGASCLVLFSRYTWILLEVTGGCHHIGYLSWS